MTTALDSIPAIIPAKVAELLNEALELAEKAHRVNQRRHQLDQTLSLLAQDPGLGIETTTYDPAAERFDVLMDRTGFGSVLEVIGHTSGVLGEQEVESLGALKKRLGLSDPP